MSKVLGTIKDHAAKLCWADYEVGGHENRGVPRPWTLCTREAGHEPAPHAGPCPLCDPTSYAKAHRIFEIYQAQSHT